MYSQRDEETVILNFFKDQSDGVFLDVGAYDGITFSNTYALLLKGWRGWYVEGSPSALTGLIHNVGSNPKAKIINAVVGLEGDSGFSRFAVSDDAISTLDSKHEETWRPKTTYWTLYSRVVSPGCLCSWLQKNGLPSVDFLSVDVEGLSDSVGYGLVLRLWPRLICVEVDDANITCRLTRVGYAVVHKTQENLIMRRTYDPV